MTAATDRLGERMGSKYPPGPVQNLFLSGVPNRTSFELRLPVDPNAWFSTDWAELEV